MGEFAIEEFLSAAEEQQIIDAIRIAEKQTSGEIRVHIEPSAKGDIENRVLEVFTILKMHNTEQHNAVLFYVAVEDKAFAIYGDKGIDAVVSDDFWNSSKDMVENHFRKGDFTSGLIAGIKEAGKQLKVFFPWQSGDDNELPNSISKNE